MVVATVILPALLVGLGTIIGLLLVFGEAIHDTFARGRKPAAESIAGFYVPRWGAYRRRKAAEDLADWDLDFKRALPE